MEVFRTIVRRNQQWMGIHTGMHAGAKGIQKLYQEGLPQGYHIQDGEVTIWQAKGWHTLDNEIYLYGEHLSGTPLAEIVSMSPVDAAHLLERLQQALATAQKAGVDLPQLSYRSVLFTDSGGVFFVPHRVADTIHSYLSPEQAFTDADSLTHPQCASGSAAAHSFAVLVLLYFILCGEQPFPAENSLQRTNLLSYYAVIPPHLYQPSLSRETSEKIAYGLNAPVKGKISTDGFTSIFAEIHNKISNNALQFPPKPQVDIEKNRIKRLFAHRIRSALYKNRPAIIVGTVALVIMGLLYTTTFTLREDDPDYSQLTAGEVVETYYSGFNSLDHTMMNDLTRGDIGNNEIDQVMQMYLASTMQLGYTYEPGIVTPREYREGVRINQYQNIYGITDLEVTIIREDDTSAEYQADFEKWTPKLDDLSIDESLQSSRSTPDARRLARRDMVALELTEPNGWIITAIDTRELQELPAVRIDRSTGPGLGDDQNP